MSAPHPLTNFISYIQPKSQKPRIGHLDFSTNLITPLSFPSGTRLTSLNQVINAGRDVRFIPSSRFDPPIDISTVKILPPLTGRDVLAVGKNYPEHAKEFNSSGFDSSDKVDIPTYPAIFTKRASSIIASGEQIYPHIGWTNTLDYEGEIGVIIAKEGFGIKEEDAWDYVWGFTIINDITARERQRDHKQFFLGKSANTFCPMGPVAVPITSLPHHESLRIITKINSELRQDSSLTQLIFPIPSLVATLSSAITLQPGDVLATGTPAGVGIGHTPPAFLKPGDTITISVPGLGVLTNTVAPIDCPPPGNQIPLTAPNKKGLIHLNNSGKLVYTSQFGNMPDRMDTIIFIHGLGNSSEIYLPVIEAIDFESMTPLRLITYDLEGHGRSPTTPESIVTIESYARDLRDLVSTLDLSRGLITLVAHGMGCLIALECMLTGSAHEEALADRVVFIGPVPIGVDTEELYRHAELVRDQGMSLEVVDQVLSNQPFYTGNTILASYIRTMLKSTDPEGYAKGCTALAARREYDIDSFDRFEMIELFEGDNAPGFLRLDRERFLKERVPEAFGVDWVILNFIDYIAKSLELGL